MLIERNKLYTVADYQAFEALPENADRLFELIEGEIVEKVASFTPSKIASRINYYFVDFNMKHDLGDVTAADGGYIMSPKSVFMPGVGFISKARLPQEPDREAPVPPDLAVEVKSPTDSIRKMRLKAEKYLDYGTQLVWLVFPDDQTVEVYKPDADVITIGIDGTLDGGDVLPGFTLAVKDIFK